MGRNLSSCIFLIRTTAFPTSATQNNFFLFKLSVYPSKVKVWKRNDKVLTLKTNIRKFTIISQISSNYTTTSQVRPLTVNTQPKSDITSMPYIGKCLCRLYAVSESFTVLKKCLWWHVIIKKTDTSMRPWGNCWLPSTTALVHTTYHLWKS